MTEDGKTNDEVRRDLLKSLGVVEVAELADDQQSLKSFIARLQEIGVDGEELQKCCDAGGKVGRDGREMIFKLMEAHRGGQTIDPEYYERDEFGQFTAKSPWAWKPGCKSPNPLGRARTKIGLWGRFCQIMQMTQKEVAALVESDKLTLADRASIRLCMKMVNEGAWQPMLEAINREEGKVKENIQIEAPPTPVRFVETPDRVQPELLEDTSKPELKTDEE